MRVGILTFHYAYNYGAVLQAYALQETLHQMGVDPVIVDYRSPAIEAHNRGRGIRSGRFLTVIPMRKRFDTFRKNHFSRTKCIKDREGLIQETKDCHALIVGSDQVWNIKVTGTDTNYFLGFINGTNIRKISYAACFGQRDQDPRDLSLVSGLLSRFDRISVRNGMSAELVTRLSGTVPEIVLDPTMLVNFDSVTTDSAPKEPYILVYALHRGMDQEQLATMTRKVQLQCGLPVYSISQQWDFPVADVHVGHIGPSEWLSYFRNAAIVCTDSFHGLIFAVKNRKRFFVTAVNDKSSRIVELADKYGFLDRVAVDVKGLNVGRCLEKDIDFDSIGGRIKVDVDQSREYLNKALLQADR